MGVGPDVGWRGSGFRTIAPAIVETQSLNEPIRRVERLREKERKRERSKD